MSNTIEIREVCDVFDGPHATPKKTATGPIYLGIDAITADCRLNPLEYNYLSEEDYKIWTKRVTPVENDIVFSYEATLGRYAMIPANFYGCLGRRLALIRVKDNRINPTWLYYYFMSPKWKVFIANHTVKGSTVDRISVEAFPSYKIPSIERQKQDDIVKILKSIDDRIENNKRICSELESMAKTLYDYWFVQFDFPDENGRPYRTSGGAMEWNDQLKREIPKGWGVKSIIDEFDVCYGYPFDTTKFTEDEDGIPIIRIRDILENTISAKTLEIVDEKYKVSRGDLIVGMDGNFHMNFWSGHSALLNQRCFKISSLGYSVLIAYFSAKPYIKAREKNVTRTTVGHLSADDVQALSVLVPTEPEKQKFSAIFDDILNKICQTRSENEELTKLRDWLLPMLMNGQARVE